MKMRAKPNPRFCSSERPQVWLVMQQLLSRPVHSFVTCWNWKAAALSCILRVPVYVITTFRHGWEAIGLAACVEGVFSAGASGVYAAFTEAVRYAVPEFVVAMLLLVIFPAITVLLDALFQIGEALGDDGIVGGVAVLQKGRRHERREPVD